MVVFSRVIPACPLDFLSLCYSGQTVDAFNEVFSRYTFILPSIRRPKVSASGPSIALVTVHLA